MIFKTNNCLSLVLQRRRATSKVRFVRACVCQIRALTVNSPNVP